MKKREIVEYCLQEASRGEYGPLFGLVYYLKHDIGFTDSQIARLAERNFQIPAQVALDTLTILHPEYIQ